MQVARLDDLIDQIRTDTACDTFLLKLDTQGYDLEAFRGAEQTLASVPVLQSELSLIDVYSGLASAYDVLRDYNSKGYAISGMYPINREDSSMAVIEYDCVMVRRNNPVD